VGGEQPIVVTQGYVPIEIGNYRVFNDQSVQQIVTFVRATDASERLTNQQESSTKRSVAADSSELQRSATQPLPSASYHWRSKLSVRLTCPETPLKAIRSDARS
jgi:hypothetical protein